MHRTIGYLSKRFVQIRPGEARKVWLTFSYFFLLITACYLIKPVSRSLVLGHLGSRLVPGLDLVCVMLMGSVMMLFGRLVHRVSKTALVTGACWVLVGLMALFWALLRAHLPWAAGVFYVGVAIVPVLSVALFWLVANDLYRPREAKRLFGFIGSGGILGGIAGSSLAAAGAQLIGTETLVLLSAGVLGGSWLVVRRLWACAVLQEGPAPAAGRPQTLFTPPVRVGFTTLGGFGRLLLQSRYLLLLVAMVVLNKLVATLISYQLNPFLEHAFQDQDARTTFIGMFLGGVNALAFAIQFVLTSWVLRRWGLFTALLALPLGLLGGCAGMILAPLFWIAAGVELFDDSMNYSLQQTTKEVLYLPLDRSIRNTVKPCIDTVVFRVGKGLAALLGILILNVWRAPSATLSYVAVSLLVAWIVVAMRLRREHLATVRTVLQARAAATRPASGVVACAERRGGSWEDELPAFELVAERPTSNRKLALVTRLITDSNATPARALVEELTRYDAPPALPSELEAHGARLRAIVNDQQVPLAKRRQALRLLARDASQATVDYLLGVVMVEEDAILRQDAVRSLVKLRLGKVPLEFQAQPIRRQVEREVRNHRRILNVAAIYRQQARGAVTQEDPALALLRMLLEESAEQTFRLLMLLYRPEDIHLVYEQLRAPDAYLRTDAIELLDTLMDPAMRTVLFPMLDEDRFLLLLDEQDLGPPEPAVAYRLLQEAIWDHNSWLSVTTLCVVGRLRLTTLRQELEKASRHHLPLIASAGKAALHLAGLP